MQYSGVTSHFGNVTQFLKKVMLNLRTHKDECSLVNLTKASLRPIKPDVRGKGLSQPYSIYPPCLPPCLPQFANPPPPLLMASMNKLLGNPKDSWMNQIAWIQSNGSAWLWDWNDLCDLGGWPRPGDVWMGMWLSWFYYTSQQLWYNQSSYLCTLPMGAGAGKHHSAVVYSYLDDRFQKVMLGVYYLAS